MRKKLFAAAWVIGILFPMAWFSQFHQTLQIWFDRIFSPVWMHILMHALLYGILAALLAAIFAGRPHRTMIILGLILCVAVLQEGLQLVPSGRLPGAGELFDWSVDLTGATAGIAFLNLWNTRLRPRIL